MTTAFVYSGGASLGSIQVGMTRALFEAGIKPDMLVGTSAGAINAAFLATHSGTDAIDELADVWRKLRRSTVFPVRPVAGFLGFFGRRNYLCTPEPLRDLLGQHLGTGDLADTQLPLRVVATDLATGREAVLDQGGLVDAVMASASLPGIFPPVKFGGRHLIDGGVINNAPLSHAVRNGADTVYLLVCGHACALTNPPASALGSILQAVPVLVGRQLVADVEHYEGRCMLHVVPQLCPLEVSPMDFSKADLLMARGHAAAAAWLDSAHSFDRPGRTGQGITIEPHTH